jgi:ATP-dependent protease ClpP protease subunit
MYKQILLALLCATTANAKTISLTESNTITLRGEVTADTIQALQFRIAEMGKVNSIYLVLDSPGGDVIAGEDFIEFAKSYKNIETVSIFAASMASAIVEALPGSRYITDSGILMFHRMKVGGLGGQLAFGELETELGMLQSVSLRMSARSAKRMDMSLDEYQAAVKDEYWLLGSQAIAKHAADEIVTITCSKALIDSSELSSTETLFGAVTIKYSKCPLFRSPIHDSKD